MSGVGITGLIANRPGTVTPYPTQDPNLELGGFRSNVATVADLLAIPDNFRTEGMHAYVLKTKCVYALQADGDTWEIEGNVNLGAQAAWFINPDNSTGLASDENDGLTAITPLLTWAQFQNRCFPNGARLNVKQNVTITVLAASPWVVPQMSLNYGKEPSLSAGALTIELIGPVVSSASMTLTGVTVIDAENDIRGQLSVASGAFANDALIRVTTGAAAGAICYSMGLVGPTQTYVGAPGIDESSTVAWPQIGDQVVIDTRLIEASRFDVNVGVQVRFRARNLLIRRAMLYGPDLNQYAGSGGAIALYACGALSTGGQWIAPFGAAYINCNVARTSRTGFSGNALLFVNHNVQGVMGSGWGSQTIFGLWINGGNWVVGVTDNFTHPGMGASCKVWIAPQQLAPSSLGAVEVENGPGPITDAAAIQICPGSIVQNDSFQSEMWGTSGGYPIGVRIFALGWLWFSNDPAPQVLSVFLKIAATVDLNVGGENFDYSDNPILFKSQAGGIVVDALNLLQTENYVRRVAETAAIGSTSLLIAGGARNGTYRVWGYLAPTVTGAAGALTLNAIYTDESGTLITQPICAINNAVLSGAGGSIEIECDGATAISYSVTGYSAGLTYNLRLALQYDGAGP